MSMVSKWKWPDIRGLHEFSGTLTHTAHYDTSITLDNKRVAVIGVGSSGIQVTANIASKVSKLYTWVRTPTWITAGFAQKYAGPNGGNFECERDPLTCVLEIHQLTRYKDTPEQKKHFKEHPMEYLNYCKQIENELNQRFKFILNGTAEAEEAKRVHISIG